MPARGVAVSRRCVWKGGGWDRGIGGGVAAVREAAVHGVGVGGQACGRIWGWGEDAILEPAYVGMGRAWEESLCCGRRGRRVWGVVDDG